jgi:hypothetical protein
MCAGQGGGGGGVAEYDRESVFIYTRIRTYIYGICRLSDDASNVDSMVWNEGWQCIVNGEGCGIILLGLT